jgi:hypothetical protein
VLAVGGPITPGQALEIGGLWEKAGRYEQATWMYCRALWGEREALTAGEALVRLAADSRVAMPALLDGLGYAYADGPRPGAACRVALELGVTLNRPEPLRWLVAHPPPDGA